MQTESAPGSLAGVPATGDVEPVLVLIPVFDDWPSLDEVLRRLDRALAAAGRTARVLVVDDGSTLPAPEGLGARGALVGVQMLRLRCNLGHERAICVGLAHVHRERRDRVVVVMDGDGEDRPEDVPRLLSEFDRRQGQQVVFAGRARRSESLVFRAFYLVFRVLHRLLVGRPIEVGSFSALPRDVLDRLVVMPQLWSHYAASVCVSKAPWCAIPTSRGTRIFGRSRLDLVALAVHGFSALSVHIERITLRVLLASTFLTTLCLVFFAAQLLGGSARPPLSDWAILPLGLLSVAMAASVLFAAALSLLILGTRSRAHFVPEEGCRRYEAGLREL